MKREWKPGDVAMLRCRDGVERLAILTDRGNMSPLWIAEAVGWGRLSDDVPVRPLVVIDPEDREQVERLHGLILRLRCRCGRLWLQESPRCEWHKSRHDRAVESRPQGSFEGLADALREYADPKPPKPEEPTGRYAVVVDDEGREWLRTEWDDGFNKPWQHEATHAHWRTIAAVRVLSAGVTEDGAQ